jgi:hypothetical protein
MDRTSPQRPLPAVILLEKEVCKSLREYWKKNEFFYIRNQQGLGSKRGTSDYTVVKDGHTMFVEAKATKGKQSPYQLEFALALGAAGGTYYLVHSVEEFIEMWQTTKWLAAQEGPY